MNRRHFLQQGLALAATLSAGRRAMPAAPAQTRAQTRKQPNIVVVLADDVGYGDLSCYGATAIRTPRLDALAAQGLRFTDAHTDAATCTPSRYAMLTGQYAWRRDGIQVLPGDAESLIRPAQATVASVLRSAGYATGLVGKWHLGLGSGTIDWNGEVQPGPCEAGFDDAFFFAATADRVPTVYIHNHRVVGLDPRDPIRVSYDKKIGTEPTGAEHPELLRMPLGRGHDGTIVDGISRMGYMTGGTAARWKDETMAATFTGKAVEFLERNQHRPFLLYFTPSDIHVPRVPAAQFTGHTCGVRCDVIEQLDWSVGKVLDTLSRLHLEDDTLVVFTSDNGPVVNDSYGDGSDRKLGEHKPAGPFRGGKYTIYEGGTRVPLLVRMPGRVRTGVSDALFTQVDLMATLAALGGASVPEGQATDSMNQLPALLGERKTARTALVEEAHVLALREGRWKLIDRSQIPGAHGRSPQPLLVDYSEDPNHTLPHPEPPHPVAALELYDVVADPHEVHNVASRYPDVVRRLQVQLDGLRQQSGR